jgi:cysteine desulfurase
VSDATIKAKKLVPIIHGGGQETGFRSGTENTLGIAAFAAAAKEGAANHPSYIAKISDLRAYAIERINEECPEISLNIPKLPAPHVLSATMPSIKSETMLHFLSARGIYVSSGSACSSHGHASGTLESFGLESKEADCTIRVSLSGEESDDDIDTFIAALANGVDSLIRIK